MMEDKITNETDILHEKTIEQFNEAKELERVLTETHPEILDKGMSIQVVPRDSVVDIFGSILSDVEELTVDVGDISTYRTLFNGTIVGTRMPANMYIQEYKKGSCWHADGSTSLADKNKGVMIGRSCVKGGNTDLDSSHGQFHFDVPLELNKKGKVAALLNHFLDFHYEYELNPNVSQSFALIESYIDISVVEFDENWNNAKTILKGEDIFRFRKQFSLASGDPVKNKYVNTPTQYKLKSIEFDGQPKRYYRLYCRFSTYTWVRDAKAYVYMKYQHIPHN